MYKPKKIMKLTSSVTALFLLVFMSFSQLTVKAEDTKVLTALGDSIGFGMSADPGKGYVDLFYSYLKDQGNLNDLQLNNLSKPGAKSSDLLDKIQNDKDMQTLISNSNIITVSIGGNNLLGPVIASVSAAFNVNPVNNPNLTTELAAAMSVNQLQTSLKLGQLMTSPELPSALTEGVKQFTTDWPEIIKSIKTLSPNADIYALNVYNPFNANDPLYATFDQFIQQLNKVIESSDGSYKIADVYTAFKEHQGTPLVNFSIALGALDPHPTTEGHKIIADSTIALYTPAAEDIQNTNTDDTAVPADNNDTTVPAATEDTSVPDETTPAASEDTTAAPEENTPVADSNSGSTVDEATSTPVDNTTVEVNNDSDTETVAADTSDNANEVTVSDNNTTSSNTTVTTLPKTGSMIDMSALIALGLVSISCGAVLVFRRKVKHQ